MNKNTANKDVKDKTAEPATPPKKIVVMKRAENTGRQQNKKTPEIKPSPAEPSNKRPFR